MLEESGRMLVYILMLLFAMFGVIAVIQLSVWAAVAIILGLFAMVVALEWMARKG